MVTSRIAGNRILAASMTAIAIIMGTFSAGSCKKSGSESINPDSVNIVNSSFEISNAQKVPDGWTVISETSDADAAHTVADGRTGSSSLEFLKMKAYKVEVDQEVTGLQTGLYTLSVWVKNSGGQNSCYVAARDYGDTVRMTSLPVTDTWKRVKINGISVTSGKIKIQLTADANAANWCRFDDLSLIKDGISYTFIKGGDISELDYVESKGGKYFEGGVEKNCLEILKNNGFNTVRLRLYNDPGNPGFSPSNRLPKGFQDPADILNLAKRAKAFGLNILLTFYYSDYWSNQTTHLWQGIPFDDLKDSVYTFTKSFMQKMKSQGTTPEFVSLGNEIAGGLLLPSGASSDFAKMGSLLNMGYSAVKDVSPSTQVVLHLDDAGNRDKYDWFFGNCTTNGINYDIIGASYYPFWTQKTVDQMRSWADYVSSKYNKSILIMETGYNWNPTLPDGKTGQLANNGPYQTVYSSSPIGQLDFLYDLFNGIKNCSQGKVIGALYWDPVMIEADSIGWELGADNVVSNTTLFDFNGNSLISLKAFKYNN